MRLTVDHKVLKADMAGETLRAAAGSMIAYTGDVDFKYAGMGGGGGFKAAFKQKVAGESIKLMNCVGNGTVYFAQDAYDITLVKLNNEEFTVESEHILALTEGLGTDVKFSGLRGVTAGHGLATTVIRGTGEVAVLSDGPLFGLKVSPQQPAVVDPDAYIASAGNMNISLVSGVSWRTLVGEGTGEPFSLRFEGEGVVYVQPSEGSHL